jgi:hypothetical protein
MFSSFILLAIVVLQIFLFESPNANTKVKKDTK